MSPTNAAYPASCVAASSEPSPEQFTAPSRIAPQGTPRRAVRWLRQAAVPTAAVTFFVALQILGPRVWQADGLGHWLVIALVMFATATVSSIAGFAFSAIATALAGPLFANPVVMVATFCVCSVTIQSYAVMRLRSEIRFKALGPMLFGGMVGIPVGTWLLLNTNATRLSAMLGLLLLAWSAHGLLRRSSFTVKSSRLGDVLVGVLGGITSGIAAAPSLAPVVWRQMFGLPVEVH